MRSATCEKCKAVFECGSRGRVPQFCKNCKTGGRSTVAVECRHCGKVFGCRNKGKGKFCSRKCVGDFNRGQHKGGRRYKCIECGKEFARHYGNHFGMYCSQDCYWTRKRRTGAIRKAEKERARILRAEAKGIDKDRRKAEKEAIRKSRLRCWFCKNQMPDGLVAGHPGSGNYSRFCSLECDQQYRKQSKERQKERRRKMRAGRVCGSHCARARRRGLPRVYSITLRKIADRDRHICQLCGIQTLMVFVSGDDTSPTIDHIVPLGHPLNTVHGHTWENTQLACFACNCKRKGRQIEDELLLYSTNPRLTVARLRGGAFPYRHDDGGGLKNIDSQAKAARPSCANSCRVLRT